MINTKKKSNSFVIYISSAIIAYYILISIWPLFYNIYLSFGKTDLITDYKFVGLRNYIFLTKDKIFWKSLTNNLIYLVLMVSIGTISSILFSIMIWKTKGFLRKFYTAMFFAPVVTSIVALSLVWPILYYPKIGVIAQSISSIFGYDNNKLTFLSDPSIALLSIVIVDIWKDTGIRTLIFLNGLDNIPKSIIESAKIEGVNNIKESLLILIPLLRPQIVFVVATYSINAIRVYVPIYMMTGSPPGGPSHSTITTTLHMYFSSFYGGRFGYGAALSLVMFVFLFILVIMMIKSFDKHWEY